MKRLITFLAIIAFPLLVAAESQVKLFIDTDNASVVSKDGSALKLASDGTQGLNVLVNGTSEMTVSATAVTLPTNALTVTAGNIAATAGSLTAGKTITAGTGITSTTGNVVATAGAVNAGTSVGAGTTVTAGTGITATTGNITATAGNLVLTAGEIVMAGISTKAAAGSTNADATALTTPVTYVTGADDATGVILAAGSTGSVRWIYNTVGNKVLKIYPPALDAVNGGTVTTDAASCPAGALCICTKVAALTWYCGL
jgi:hypothetical protein